jgi:hypothetical protein
MANERRAEPRRRQARQPSAAPPSPSTSRSRRSIREARGARRGPDQGRRRDRGRRQSAALVDLSAVGAQVVSPTVLKPNQRVRVVMGDGKAQVKCAGAIAWAAFEMPKGMPTRYRAGIDLGDTPKAQRRRFAQEEQERNRRGSRPSARPRDDDRFANEVSDRPVEINRPARRSPLQAA